MDLSTLLKPVDPSFATIDESGVPSLAVGASRMVPKGTILMQSKWTDFVVCSASIYNAIKEHDYFYRGGVVARVVDGLALQAEVKPEHLRAELSRYGTLSSFKMDSHGKVVLRSGETLSQDHAKVVLASDEARKLLPPLAGLHDHPLLIESPKRHPKLLKRGYHEDLGGRYVFKGSAFSIPHNDAKKLLFDLISEFHFTSAADMSRAMALLITPAIKFGQTSQCMFPIFVAEADKTQSGKGFLVELCQSIYNSTPSILAKKKGGVGSFDEAVAEALVAGNTFIQMDNLREPVDSQYLEMVLTSSSPVPCRIAGQRSIQIDPTGYIFQITSNGFSTTADMGNRFCMVRIKNREGHAYRTFPEGGLIEHVRRNQGTYLGAIYSILKQWIIAGKPKTSDTRGPGRFREWWQIADWICQSLDLVSPLDGHSQVTKRAASPEATWLRQVANAASSKDGFCKVYTAGELLDIAEGTTGIETPGLAKCSMSQQGMLVGKILNRVFQTDRVELDDIIATRSTRKEEREGKGSREIKIYSFQKSGEVVEAALETSLPTTTHETHEPPLEVRTVNISIEDQTLVGFVGSRGGVGIPALDPLEEALAGISDELTPREALTEAYELAVDLQAQIWGSGYLIMRLALKYDERALWKAAEEIESYYKILPRTQFVYRAENDHSANCPDEAIERVLPLGFDKEDIVGLAQDFWTTEEDLSDAFTRRMMAKFPIIFRGLN